MVDFDLEEHLKNGISFRRIFKSIILYSISIFIGFYWKDLIAEIINNWMPEGTGLTMKVVIATGVTMVLVGFCYLIVRSDMKKNRLNTCPNKS